jgi:hypothetical protein
MLLSLERLLRIKKWYRKWASWMQSSSLMEYDVLHKPVIYIYSMAGIL